MSTSHTLESPETVVLVRTPSGLELEARLVHVRTEAIEASFPGPRPPALPIAERVELSLKSPEITVKARVVHCQVEGTGLSYRFEIDPESRVALGGLFNRRRAVRVRASTPAIDVALFAEGIERPARGVLNDISETGASILIPTEDERMLFAARRIGLEFILPGDPRPMRLVGMVRHRGLVGSAIRYGIHFDAQASKGFDEIQQRIYAYVIKREVEAAGRR